MDTAVSIDSVNNLIQGMNKSHALVIERLDSMDYNIMTDVAHLSSYVDKLAEAVVGLSKTSEPAVTTVKLPKFKIALAIGLGVYVGIKVTDGLKPKKEK